MNDVVIPELAISNPALDQSNSLTVGVAATNTSATRQTATQASANSNAMVLLSLEADQQADVKQSGDAGAGQAQANRLNVAHWNGLVATPEPPADELPAAVPPTDDGVAVPPAVSDVELRRPYVVLGLVGPTLRAGDADVPVRPRGAAARRRRSQAPAGAVFSATSPSSGLLAAETPLELAPARAGRAAADALARRSGSVERSLARLPDLRLLLTLRRDRRRPHDRLRRRRGDALALPAVRTLRCWTGAA